jgi:hypothetical protein
MASILVDLLSTWTNRLAAHTTMHWNGGVRKSDLVSTPQDVVTKAFSKGSSKVVVAVRRELMEVTVDSHQLHKEKENVQDNKALPIPNSLWVSIQ